MQFKYEIQSKFIYPIRVYFKYWEDYIKIEKSLFKVDVLIFYLFKLIILNCLMNILKVLFDISFYDYLTFLMISFKIWKSKLTKKVKYLKKKYLIKHLKYDMTSQ